MGTVKTEALVVIGVALAVVYLAKGAAATANNAVQSVEDMGIKLWDASKDAAQAVNPLNDNNVINQGATKVYQAATGSTGTIGGDLYDATHTGMLRDVSWWQLLEPGTAVGTVAGTKISDSIKSWWNGL